MFLFGATSCVVAAITCLPLKRGRVVVGMDDMGSDHDADRLAWRRRARERLHAGQQVLELQLAAGGRADAGLAVVEAANPHILCNALSGLYDALGFAAAGDEAFRAPVLGRIMEPTSKLDTVRALVSEACFAHATRTGGLALVLYT